MSEIDSAALSSGARAVLQHDPWVPGGLSLVVAGIPQSHVLPGDPTYLHFEYVQRIGHVIDLIGEPGAPLTALHLGAGAMTLPRYVEATRPGSRQQVLELEPALVDLVRAHAPLPRGASIRIRYGDAREVLAKLPPGLDGAADLVVSDVFAGARTPPHIASVEFYAEAAKRLASTGVLVVNAMTEPGLANAKRQAATLAEVLPHTMLLSEVSLLKGNRYGNVVLVGSHAPLPLEFMPRLMAMGPHPGKVVSGTELVRFIGSTRPVRDGDDVHEPPAPPATTF